MNSCKQPMAFERIDFISEYCDRWCERCAFTTRCSAFAVGLATAMCDGDFEAGVELAVGVPRPRDNAEAAEREAELARRIEEMNAASSVDEALITRADERHRRVQASPISVAADTVRHRAWAWLAANAERLSHVADPVLREAIDVAGWDAALIGAKLHRGISGRSEFDAGEAFGDHPVQNDWNGSIKVALVCISRSIDAWATIAAATSDATALGVSCELTHLKGQVERAFPDAWRFRRPGFDTLRQP